MPPQLATMHEKKPTSACGHAWGKAHLNMRPCMRKGYPLYCAIYIQRIFYNYTINHFSISSQIINSSACSMQPNIIEMYCSQFAKQRVGSISRYPMWCSTIATCMTNVFWILVNCLLEHSWKYVFHTMHCSVVLFLSGTLLSGPTLYAKYQ